MNLISKVCPSAIAHLAVFCCTSTSIAQISYCHLYWEGSDGGNWTRQSLTTAQREIDIRLVAEWAAPLGRAFGGTLFDGVVSNAQPLDTASNFVRGDNFSFAGQSIISSRFGNQIKIDDSRDPNPPGVGPQNVSIFQSNGAFEEPLNEHNPVVLFSFHLTMDDAAEVRHVRSIHRQFSGSSGNVRIWLVSTEAVDVIATQQELDINYVPAPETALMLCCAAAPLLRRRRA